MKHISFFRNICVLILSIIASTSFAQMRGGAKESRLWVGPQLGVNVSNFYTDTASIYNKYKPGFLGGLSINFAFNNSFCIQTEGNYSPKGGKFRIKGDTLSRSGSYQHNYIDVPLILMFKGGEDDNSLFFQIGAQQSFLLNAKYSEEITTGGITTTISNSDADSLGVPKNDFGFLASLGMISTYGWSVTLRAYAGLGDITDKYNKITPHHLVFSFSMGYYFGRKHDVIGGRRR